MVRSIALTLLCLVVYQAFGADHVRVERTWSEKPGSAVSLQDILGVVDIGGVAAAPGGRFVAFITRQADAACDCHHQTLYVLDRRTNSAEPVADLGDPFRFVEPNGSVNGALVTAQPLWSPDEQKLAFIANRSAVPALMILDRSKAGEGARVATQDPAFAFAWGNAPDTIIYQTGGPDPSVVAALRLDDKNGFLYGPQFRGVAPGHLPTASSSPPAVFATPQFDKTGRSAHSEFRLLKLANSRSEKAGAEEERALRRKAIASSNQSITDDQWRSLSSSDSSSRLEVIVKDGAQDIVRLQRSDRSGDSVQVVRNACSGSVVGAYCDAKKREFIISCIAHRAARWTEGEGIFVRINPRDATARKWFGIQAPGIFDGRIGRNCDLADGDMICVEEEPSSPPRLVSISADGKRHPLFDPNVELRKKHFGRVDKLVWSNDFGAETWGYLVYPPGYSRNRKYPFVIVQYNASGFLRGGTGNEYPVFPFAQSQFFVLNLKHPAPISEKPSLSRTERIAAQLQGDKWRRSTQSSLDIVTDYLIANDMIDRERVAYTGLSGGANQIDFALSNARRIAVAISSTCCLGPENWPAIAANLQYSEVLKMQGKENPALDTNGWKEWKSTSPSLNVEQIHTAFLANMTQHEMLASMALWVKMRALHRPMEVYVYANEYHLKSSPAHRQSIYQRNVDWLRFWLQGIEDESEDRKDQYSRWREMRMEWLENDARAVDVKLPRYTDAVEHPVR